MGHSGPRPGMRGSFDRSYGRVRQGVPHSVEWTAPQSESFFHEYIHFPQYEERIRMPTETQRLADLSEIRNYVSKTLCEKDRLEANYFPLSEQVLVRGGAPCGVYFCLHGPRSLCLTAVWETDSNTIFFYGSRGERFRKTRLISPPGIVADAGG